MGLQWFRRRPAPAQHDTGSAMVELSLRLLAPAAQASGTRIAADLVSACAALDRDKRHAWFEWLTETLAPPPGPLTEAVRAYLAQPTTTHAAQVTRAAEPPRQALLRRINTAPGGTRLLIDLRRDLLALLKAHRHLAPLEDDLVHLLASWFNRGFLSLRRIDWSSPATLLEQLIAHEAVHEIKGWDDLHRRLEGDRRCYGFFHPALPDEPLIFVEVALTNGLPVAIADILDAPVVADAASGADTAIFYSISNCQAGLRGIGFGNLLIKQIIADIREQRPAISRFATLSPVPTLVGWLKERGRSESGDLASLCCEYLTTNRLTVPGMRIDPVAHFHLSNGARLERILLDADRSARGRAQSHGVMVNYVYEPATIETNALAYEVDGSVASVVNDRDRH